MQKTKFIFSSIKWGDIAHGALSLSVPLIVLMFIELEIAYLALLVVIASKWRIIAVQPRHWLANFRANSPDIIVNFSFVIMLMRADSFLVSFFWTITYIGWLLWLKPQSKEVMVGLQSLVTQFLGLTALFWLADSLPETIVVLLAWLIGLSASRHYLSHFEEPLIRMMSFGWALFTAQLAWLMNRWLVIYPLRSDIVIPQIAVVLTLIGYLLGTIYYLNANDKLKRAYIRRYLLVGSVMLGIIIYLTDWQFSL
jgi:hypothetical protein